MRHGYPPPDANPVFKYHRFIIIIIIIIVAVVVIIIIIIIIFKYSWYNVVK